MSNIRTTARSPNEPTPRVLVLIPYYLPGYKAGGAFRSLSNMARKMGDRFEFWIVTKDRDAGDCFPYEDVLINGWNRVGKAQVYYASPGKLSFKSIIDLIKEVAPDIIYLNSFFYPLTIKYLVCRRLRIVPSIPTVIAPHGEFSSGALKLKAKKKRLFIALATRIGLYEGLTWQATSTDEVTDIRSTCGNATDLHFAPYVLERQFSNGSPTSSLCKNAGSLRLVFVSRITPKKNLLFVLQLLEKIRGQVIFDIYGPIEQSNYWHACLDVIRAMPDNIRVTYNGPVPNNTVRDVFAGYHFFVLPTLGENFGHAILEALSAGCPVIVSDQTPWRDLAKQGVGWDLPLEEVDRWLDVLHKCISLDDEAFQTIASQARQIADECVCRSETLEQNISLFTNALTSTHPPNSTNGKFTRTSI